jgi:hypothetical protein
MNATARPPLNAVTRKTDPISYSKRLVNEFNLESAPGKGTRVTITRILLSPDGMAINSSRVLLSGVEPFFGYDCALSNALLKHLESDFTATTVNEHVAR